MAWITDHLGEPLTLEAIAAEAHMSSRTLARRFRAETGDSVQDWIALRRVELARGLLEANLQRQDRHSAVTSGRASSPAAAARRRPKPLKRPNECKKAPSSSAVPSRSSRRPQAGRGEQASKLLQDEGAESS
jgi:AraC-like DNA-binding protein